MLIRKPSKDLVRKTLKKILLDGLIERQLLLCKIREENYGKEDSIQKSWLPYKRESDIKYFINSFLPEKQPISGKVLKDEYNKNKELFKTEGQVHATSYTYKNRKGNAPG